jgi:ubiquinone/menaquinone biosynthesis C-methylase UbiE
MSGLAFDGKTTAFEMSTGSAAKFYTSLPDWWNDHYVVAPTEIVEFFSGDGISLADQVILDVGCGDGVLSLGLLQQSGASKVIGIDVVSVNRDELNAIAIKNGVEELPTGEKLQFLVSSPTHIPLDDASVDVVVSWSVFEHVQNIGDLLAEIRRVVKPGGLIFTQIWPMFGSEHGSHLWPWLSDGFIQYRQSREEIYAEVDAKIPDHALRGSVKDLFDSCNRVTVDELQQFMLSAGLTLEKVQLSSEGFHLDKNTQHIPLSKLGITGIKIISRSHER